MTTTGMQSADEGVAKQWWLLLLWGIAAILLGLFLTFQPGVSALVAVQVAAVFFVAGGIFGVVAAILARDEGWILRLVIDALGIIAGVVILANPTMGTLFSLGTLYYILGFIGLVIGALNMIGLGGNRASDGRNWTWGRFFLGLVQVILALFLLAHPIFGMLSFIVILGILMIAAGIITIFWSFRVRGTATA